MNREIKFRAWQKWHEYMFTPDYIDFINGNIIIGEHDGDSRYEDIPLMQYTGLKDKNGKEIYEGDIVNIKQYGSQKKVIVEIDEDGVFPFGYKYSEWDGYYPQTAEVIGNIYENPELKQSSQ